MIGKKGHLTRSSAVKKLFAFFFYFCFSNTVCLEKNTISIVKHGSGGVMIWGCFAASGPGQLAVTFGTMNSAVCLKKS